MKEIILTIHILLATLWIGGMLFMVFVLSPYVRSLPNSVEAFQKVGKRFSLIGTFIGLPALLITGIGNMHNLGITFSDLLHRTSPYASTLHDKVHLFLLTFILALIHDLYLGPRSHLNEKFRIATRIIGVINLIIGILIVFLAAKLRFGG
ncbi:CopD family protein [Sulfurihydrogenibium subterraneum]|uniref:CopD family protein n=1 Tax=Sulfurihydrogenibium subterraneum TaxID=171121 RepID=UPI00048BB720|nr:CopD family protein [Sulfurihydrogenibium subterraneum]